MLHHVGQPGQVFSVHILEAAVRSGRAAACVLAFVCMPAEHRGAARAKLAAPLAAGCAGGTPPVLPASIRRSSSLELLPPGRTVPELEHINHLRLR